MTMKNRDIDKSRIKRNVDALDDLAKSISGQTVRHDPTPVSASPRRTSHSMVKSCGPGGIQFDFGPMTGNPIADNATRILNQCCDQTQADIAAGQRNEIGQAFGNFISKGEQHSPFGAIPEAWTKQMAGSCDEAIKGMFERGELDCSEDGSVKSVGPALRNRFNQNQIQLGGELVKATSETDAALIEMMKHQGLDDGNNEEYSE